MKFYDTLYTTEHSQRPGKVFHVVSYWYSKHSGTLRVQEAAAACWKQGDGTQQYRGRSLLCV
jgi:hypothetical protein